MKSIVSILDKMQRKNVSMNDIEKKIEDLAGIRIICQFVEDIDRVVNLIKNRTDMKVKCEKDYVSHMKTSGYRSYHMIILYTVNTIHGPKELSAAGDAEQDRGAAGSAAPSSCLWEPSLPGPAEAETKRKTPQILAGSRAFKKPHKICLLFLSGLLGDQIRTVRTPGVP